MQSIRQTWFLTALGIRSLSQRLGTSAVIVISITTVTGVMVAMLALGQGLAELARADVLPDQVVVLSSGSQTVGQSSLPPTVLNSISDKPGIRRDPQGKPEIYGSALMYMDAVSREHRRSTVSLYFVTPEFWRLNSGIRIIEGRSVQPGLNELVVSDVIRNRFRDMNVGDQVGIRNSSWKVVGVYHSKALQDSIIGDADSLLSAFPQSAFNAVNVIVESPDAFASFKHAVTGDPSLALQVMTQSESNEATLRPQRQLFDFISYFLGGLMGLGAACGALACLYASVDSRTFEIGTLRAIGFKSVPVVVSVLVEGMLLALIAAPLGAGIAAYLFNGHVVEAQGITFPMVVSWRLVIIGIFWSLAIGIIGGILPSIRAARLPVVTALAAR
jgi:putative ABC transport system permease protein